jgi:long-chain acyl-CoA synthetase
MYRLKRARDLSDPARSAHAARIVLDGARIASPVAPSPPQIDPDALAVLQYTGGTTGRPKAVALTHANLAANVGQLIRWAGAGLTPGQERLLGVLPLFHIFGLTGVLLVGIAIGAELTLLPRFDVPRLVETIRDVCPTLVPGVPSMFATLLDHPTAAEVDLSSITLALSGGAPLSPDLAARFAARAKGPLVSAYGLSEASPAIAISSNDAGSNTPQIAAPLADTEITIRDPERPSIVLPAGMIGEVCVRGPQVMRGYWSRPEATRAVFIDGYLRTGDLGSLDARGHLRVADRIADVIVRAGFRILPQRIEDALLAEAAVAEAVVVGVPDPGAGQVPVACVTLRAGHTTTSAALLAAIASRLSTAEMPVRVEIHEALPKTVIGKLSRQGVRDLLASGRAS